MNSWYDCTGTFLEECNNRFISLVNVDGNNVEAYVQCSCRLDNFVDLRGKTVYLKKISNPRRAKYIIIAFKKGNSFALLSPKYANDLFFDFLKSRRASLFGPRKNIKKEYTVENYKSDYYIFDSKTIIEVKALLSMDTISMFPTVYSERALNQLDKIEHLLEIGYTVYYEIVSINPTIKKVMLNVENSLLAKRLVELEKKGLIIEYKKACIRNNIWVLKSIN